jgi:hypothetical protein
MSWKALTLKTCLHLLLLLGGDRNLGRGKLVEETGSLGAFSWEINLVLASYLLLLFLFSSPPSLLFGE